MAIPSVGSGVPVGGGVRLDAGIGSPEGVVAASVGSIWIQIDGANGLIVWQKSSGSGSTGWTFINAGTTSTFNAAAFLGATKEAKITVGFAAAAAAGAKYLFIPQSMLPYDAANVTYNTAVRPIREGSDPSEFDVEAYGAGDNSTAATAASNTLAIQAAIDAQNVKKVGWVRLIGAYNYANTLSYYAHTCIRGGGTAPDGVGGSGLLQMSGAVPMMLPAVNRANGMVFEDFYLYGGGNASNTGGLDLTGAHDFHMTRIAVSSCKVYNIRCLGGTTGGDSGFGNFTEVENINAVDDYWLIGSSANDQPDQLNFSKCRTIGNTAAGAWIHYSCTGAKAGPGTNSWRGCSFEGAPFRAILVDAAGAGINWFFGCRWETTTTPGLTFILYGFGVQPFGMFVGNTYAVNGGTLTWTDNGPNWRTARIGENVPATLISGQMLYRFEAIQDGQYALVSGVTPAIDTTKGNYYTLAILTNIAVVIAVPLNPPSAGYSQEITIAIRNSSGGALATAPTFNGGANGFKFSAVTNPANGTQVLYKFRWDSVQSFWYEVGTHLAAGI